MLRLMLFVAASIFFSILLFTSPSRAFTTEWSAHVEDISRESTVRGDSQSAVVTGCFTDPITYPDFSLKVDEVGAVSSFVPHATSGRTAIGCFGQNAVMDTNDILYRVEADTSYSPMLYYVTSYDGSTHLWTRQIISTCGVTEGVFGLQLGADNNLYLIATCPNNAQVVSIDTANGGVRFQETVGQPGGFYPYTLVPYSDGMAYATSREGTDSHIYNAVVFIDFDGNVTDRVKMMPKDTALAFFAIGADDILFTSYRGSHTNSCLSVLCVDMQTKAGVTKTLQLTLPSSAIGGSVQSIMPSPNGGFVVVIRYINEFTEPFYEVQYIDRNHNAHTIAEGMSSWGYEYEAPQVRVDAFGKIVVMRKRSNTGPVIEPGPLAEHAFIGVFSEQDGAQIGNTFSTEEYNSSDPNTNNTFLPKDMTLYEGGVYLLLACAGEFTCDTTRDTNVLHKLSVPDLLMEYQPDVMPDTLIRYTALGDSYSAGEGVEPFSPGTNLPGQNECHRSELAYPRLLLENTPLYNNGFWACSGAKTFNLTTVPQNATQPVQFDVIPPDTDVITLTIGGNDFGDSTDFGFGQVAITCIREGEEECEDAREEARDLLTPDDHKLKLIDVFEELETKINSNTHVFVSGYPQLFPETVDPMMDCTWGKWVPGVIPGRSVTNEEREDVRSLTALLNLRTEQAVQTMGSNFHYLDPTGSFGGHELCTEDPWFIDVVAHIDQLAYTYHPNAEGQAAYAGLFEDAIELYFDF